MHIYAHQNSIEVANLEHTQGLMLCSFLLLLGTLTTSSETNLKNSISYFHTFTL